VRNNNWNSLSEVTKPVYKSVPIVHCIYDEKGKNYFHWSIIEEQVQTVLNWLKGLIVKNLGN